MAALPEQCVAFRGTVEVFGVDVGVAGDIDSVIAARHLFAHLDAANDPRRLLRLMARDIICKVPAWQQDVAHRHHALAAVFAAQLVAAVTARVVALRAGLRAEEGLVHGLRVAPSLAPVAAPCQAAVAS